MQVDAGWAGTLERLDGMQKGLSGIVLPTEKELAEKRVEAAAAAAEVGFFPRDLLQMPKLQLCGSSAQLLADVLETRALPLRLLNHCRIPLRFRGFQARSKRDTALANRWIAKHTDRKRRHRREEVVCDSESSN